VKDFLEMRSEQLELALLPGFEPSHLGARDGFRETGYEAHGCGNGVVTLTAHLAKVRNLPVGKALGIGVGTIQQASNARSGEQRMVFGLQSGKLLSPDVRASARHHHGGVPAQEGERSAEGVEPFELLFELLIRRG
jgi:hypothetical protein